MHYKIPYNRPFIVGKELYYIAQAVMKGTLSGDGPYTKMCHSWLEKKLGCIRAFLTHSCTGALEMAAMLCDIEPGDEIIMPSFTFVSTANAFALRGGVPVFVDIRKDTLNMDESLILRAITEKTKAIVPVHYAGVACAMDEIMSLAEQYKLWVIEDAAQALLSVHNGSHLGTIGHMGCLSFHETKNIISGEGGALLLNDADLIDRAEIIREKGTNRGQFFRGKVDKYTWMELGSSYLPSELIGAFLYAQLQQAEEIVAARTKLFQRYMQGLEKMAEKQYIRLPYVSDGCACNGHIFYLLTRNHTERTELIQFLKELGINGIFHYIPLHSSPAGKKYGKVGSDMTKTDDLSGRVIRLPLFYEMDLSEIDSIVDAIENFYRNR
jgi:dTDP-4-amino-4,6-dideoxygalactose transaminase